MNQPKQSVLDALAQTIRINSGRTMSYEESLRIAAKELESRTLANGLVQVSP